MARTSGRHPASPVPLTRPSTGRSQPFAEPPQRAFPGV